MLESWRDDFQRTICNDQATSDSESTEFARRRKRRSKGAAKATIISVPNAEGSGTAAAVEVKDVATEDTRNCCVSSTLNAVNAEGSGERELKVVCQQNQT